MSINSNYSILACLMPVVRCRPARHTVNTERGKRVCASRPSTTRLPVTIDCDLTWPNACGGGWIGAASSPSGWSGGLGPGISGRLASKQFLRSVIGQWNGEDECLTTLGFAITFSLPPLMGRPQRIPGRGYCPGRGCWWRRMLVDPPAAGHAVRVGGPGGHARAHPGPGRRRGQGAAVGAHPRRGSRGARRAAVRSGAGGRPGGSAAWSAEAHRERFQAVDQAAGAPAQR